MDGEIKESATCKLLSEYSGEEENTVEDYEELQKHFNAERFRIPGASEKLIELEKIKNEEHEHAKVLRKLHRELGC